MQNTTNKSLARRKSIATARRPRLTFNFLRQNLGSLTVTTIETGAKKCTFSSPATGRTAFAYGKDFPAAYRNLQRNFNQKYSA